MLPIDEHAKSGAEVWVLADDRALKVTWEDDVGGWLTPDGSFVPERWARGYLPASWVENAAKMREALETHAEWARREKAGPDYGGLTRDTHPDGERISSEWFYGNVDLCVKAEVQTTEALAATE